MTIEKEKKKSNKELQKYKIIHYREKVLIRIRFKEINSLE